MDFSGQHQDVFRILQVAAHSTRDSTQPMLLISLRNT
ncbi:hypothetical protein VAB18032_10035 [Micromonospora maris AB-18-032]|nr:hypothetical protein VAB18032_10035 [Micromonospora maris AB-18-032]